MKLFQKLLLAPAVIGFLSPIAANATEANLKGVARYNETDLRINQDSFKPLSNKNPLLAGGEGLNQVQNDDFDGDIFSSTTQAEFFSNFIIGSAQGTSDQRVGATYDFGFDLTTSFNGNDALAINVIAGGGGTLTELGLEHTEVAEGSSTADQAQIDGISYTTTLGDRLTVFAGNGVSGGSLYNTACVYTAVTDTLEECGAASSGLDLDDTNTAFGASIDLGKGYSVSLSYEGEGTDEGILTKESIDAYGIQFAYSNDTLGLSLSWADIENNDGTVGDKGTGATTYTAVNGFYAPDIANFPSFSFGYEWSHNDAVGSGTDQTTNYFAGVQWNDVGNGSLGAAVGTSTPTTEDSEALVMYEAYYTYNYADGLTITPLIYVKEQAGNAGDETGIVLKSSFSF
tara:strand:+ start:507 stop:1706 length:1200 start_codon:yes stop_codon:yes gene_type:complete